MIGPRVKVFSASVLLLGACLGPLATRARADLFKTGKVRLVEEFRTDDAALPDEAIFRNPLGLVVDAGGNAYVSDWTAHHVKVFGPDGAFRRIIGRPGKGPGDLRGPSVIAVSDGCLVVWESINQRFSILGLDGTFLATAPRLQGAWGELYRLSALPDGRFVAFVDMGFAEPAAGPLPSERHFAVLLLSPELTVVKTLYERSLRSRNWFRHPETQAVGQAPFPYHPLVAVDVSPSGAIAIGCSRAYEIGIYDPDKGRTLDIQRPYAPVKVEERDRKAHFDAFTLRVMSGSQMQTIKGAPAYIVKATEFPESFPPYRGICFDGRGYLWVQIYAADRATNVFDVFSPKGEFVSRITLEGGPIEAAFSSFGFKQFQGDCLWKIEKDADEFASLVKYRLMPGT
jgi:hypothetical protein